MNTKILYKTKICLAKAVHKMNINSWCDFIFVFIKAELNDQRKEWRMQERSTTELAQLYLVRILINFLVLALLGGALYLITFTAEQMIEVRIYLIFSSPE